MDIASILSQRKRDGARDTEFGCQHQVTHPLSAKTMVHQVSGKENARTTIRVPVFNFKGCFENSSNLFKKA